MRANIYKDEDTKHKDEGTKVYKDEDKKCTGMRT